MTEIICPTSPLSRDLQQMVKDCLDPNPDRRPTMDQILAKQAVQSRMHLLPVEGGVSLGRVHLPPMEGGV